MSTQSIAAGSESGPTHPLSVVSIISGIACWTVLPVIGAIVAVFTGHLALREIGHEPGTGQGRPLAIAGLVLGYACLSLLLLVAVVGISALGAAAFFSLLF